jgi:methionyl-tRNA synthetase
MFDMKKLYITTPIYYVNDVPHIGHAYTTIAADVLARFHRSQGDNVFLLTGTDEHGLKIQHKAEEAGKKPQRFVDEIAGEFKKLWNKLGIGHDNFIRTTDPAHKKAVEKALQTLYEKGAIYKGEYEGLYCVACEQFRHENELVDGRCPDHDIVLEKIKEECYLLKMADLQEKLISEIENDNFSIWPERYKKEILSFLKNEKLKDISISRKNVSWGIPLPFDKEHTTYVWVDAFLNYLTGLGWGGSTLEPSSRVARFWPADVQLIGKDILRVHATIWPIMLLHLGIPLPKMLFVHGHIRSGGRKMSKTLGNTISIEEMLEKFGVDGTRYLLMSAGTFGEDVDVTMERMVEKYNADLANGLGNLVSRVVKMLRNTKSEILNPKQIQNSKSEIRNFILNLEINQALEHVWNIIRRDDKFVEDNKPWELAKNDEKKFEEVMKKLVSDLYLISELVVFFMPETAEKIKKALGTKKANILFPRVK